MRFLATLLISLLAMNGGLSAAHASTPFTFSNLFTNHLVLQRGMKDPVWGWAKPRQKLPSALQAIRLRQPPTRMVTGWLNFPRCISALPRAV